MLRLSNPTDLRSKTGVQSPQFLVHFQEAWLERGSSDEMVLAMSLAMMTSAANGIVDVLWYACPPSGGWPISI